MKSSLKIYAFYLIKLVLLGKCPTSIGSVLARETLKWVTMVAMMSSSSLSFEIRIIKTQN